MFKVLPAVVVFLMKQIEDHVRNSSNMHQFHHRCGSEKKRFETPAKIQNKVENHVIDISAKFTFALVMSTHKY